MNADNAVTPAIPTVIPVILVPTDALIDAPRNANRMSPDLVAAMRAGILREGFLQPILVKVLDAAAGTFEIVDGHHRTHAARELLMPRLPCVVMNGTVTRERAEALGLLMNRARGQIDLTVASQIVADLAGSGWTPDELLYTGFSTQEIDDLLEAARPETPDQLLDQGMSLPESGGDEAAGEYVLELKFKNRDEFAAAKKQLRKAGRGDMTAGLLKLLGDA